MVDFDKIRQKINFIEDNLSKLETFKKYTLEQFTGDFILIAAAKHFLQVSIEAMIDIANHIIARERFSAPTSAADAFKILSGKNVIPESSAKQYGLMAKFRNRIVHFYYELDSEEIYKIIQSDLDDYKTFIKEITDYLRQGKKP